MLCDFCMGIVEDGTPKTDATNIVSSSLMLNPMLLCDDHTRVAMVRYRDATITGVVIGSHVVTRKFIGERLCDHAA